MVDQANRHHTDSQASTDSRMGAVDTLVDACCTACFNNALGAIPKSMSVPLSSLSFKHSSTSAADIVLSAHTLGPSMNSTTAMTLRCMRGHSGGRSTICHTEIQATHRHSRVNEGRLFNLCHQQVHTKTIVKKTVALVDMDIGIQS